MTQLINTGGSAHIHGRIPEGITRRFPREDKETPETPATPKLFNVREDIEQELLNETRAQVFHDAVAQLLFI